MVRLPFNLYMPISSLFFEEVPLKVISGYFYTSKK
jgi:hypothetical protein